MRWMLTDDIAQYEVEKRLRHADGHTLWALVTVSLVRDAHDKPLYLISQVQDVTARKEAERELWESRERLQDIIDNTTAVIYLKDQDGRYLLVNDRFEMLYGHPPRRGGRQDRPRPLPARDGGRELAQTTSRCSQPESRSTSRRSADHEDGPRVYLSTRFPLFHSDDPKGAPYARLHDLHRHNRAQARRGGAAVERGALPPDRRHGPARLHLDRRGRPDHRLEPAGGAHVRLVQGGGDRRAPVAGRSSRSATARRTGAASRSSSKRAGGRCSSAGSRSRRSTATVTSSRSSCRSRRCGSTASTSSTPS